MPKKLPSPIVPPGQIPVIDVSGSSRQCGEMLGYAWREALQAQSQGLGEEKPWWRHGRLKRLLSQLAPHLPDLFCGMAKGAGLPEGQIYPPGFMQTRPESGCTSFALQPTATLAGEPISGQTKDTQVERCFRYQVLRLRIDDGPSMLTLTYPGWLFGHGFITGGCAIFRNSLYAGDPDGQLSYEVWGLLALHAPSVNDVVDFTRRLGVKQGFHCVIADEAGGVVGNETGQGGIAVLRPKRGIYTHANAVVSSKKLMKHEQTTGAFQCDSLHRQTRLRELFESNQGRLTAQMAYAALMDQDGFPNSICRHVSSESMTSASVIAQPTRGELHVTRGYPSQNWPQSVSL